MPHCPLCGLEPADGRSRCPLDSAFLHSLYCGACAGEIGWRDLFCGKCGQAVVEKPLQETVPLQPAPFARTVGAFVVDGLAVLALAPVLFSFLPEVHSLGSLPTCIPFLWVYWVVLWSAGRQSLGQFVFRVVALNERRLPLRPGQVAYALSFGLLSRRGEHTRIKLWLVQEGG